MCGCGYHGTGFTHVSCTMAALEPSASSGSSLSESGSTQVSDLATGNTSTGSEPGVQSLLDLLKAPQRSELTRKI